MSVDMLAESVYVVRARSFADLRPLRMTSVCATSVFVKRTAVLK